MYTVKQNKDLPFGKILNTYIILLLHQSYKHNKKNVIGNKKGIKIYNSLGLKIKYMQCWVLKKRKKYLITQKYHPKNKKLNFST